MSKKNFFIINKIEKKYFDKNQNKKIEKKLNFFIKDIKEKLANTKSFYNLFEESFKLNFNEKEINKFNHFKEVVIIGMGGSALGSEAIYHFLKQ